MFSYLKTQRKNTTQIRMGGGNSLPFCLFTLNFLNINILKLHTLYYPLLFKVLKKMKTCIKQTYTITMQIDLLTMNNMTFY